MKRGYISNSLFFTILRPVVFASKIALKYSWYLMDANWSKVFCKYPR